MTGSFAEGVEGACQRFSSEKRGGVERFATTIGRAMW